jgi:UDPglucose--hexose-1-phosphate uridylyltransferase
MATSPRGVQAWSADHRKVAVGGWEATVELHREVLAGEILDPGKGFARVQTSLEVRWDPLTGHGARLVSAPAPLFPQSDFDLAALGETTGLSCPFCRERIEVATPRFPPEVCEDGRFRQGEAIVFPNLVAYAQYASVAVYGPDRHFLPLDAMTPRLVADNLGGQAAFVRAVTRRDSRARLASISANHMLPSGSSVFHPHTQGSVGPDPTTFQRVLADVPAERFTEYVETEQRVGVRYLGNTGRVAWLASFAPAGPGELRAVVSDASTPADLVRDLVDEVGWGIATALGLYAELGFGSFNLAMYGTPPGNEARPMLVRMVCRANLSPLYRSDVMWLERLHGEAAVDVTPEHIAELAGGRFRR